MTARTLTRTEWDELCDAFAAALKDWVTDDLAPDLGATFAADLLGYALELVEWNDIADAWIEQVQEQVA